MQRTLRVAFPCPSTTPHYLVNPPNLHPPTLATSRRHKPFPPTQSAKRPNAGPRRRAPADVGTSPRPSGAVLAEQAEPEKEASARLEAALSSPLAAAAAALASAARLCRRRVPALKTESPVRVSGSNGIGDQGRLVLPSSVERHRHVTLTPSVCFFVGTVLLGAEDSTGPAAVRVCATRRGERGVRVRCRPWHTWTATTRVSFG